MGDTKEDEATKQELVAKVATVETTVAPAKFMIRDTTKKGKTIGFEETLIN